MSSVSQSESAGQPNPQDGISTRIVVVLILAAVAALCAAHLAWVAVDHLLDGADSPLVLGSAAFLAGSIQFRKTFSPLNRIIR